MQFKPTLFSLSGFLAPGTALLAILGVMYFAHDDGAGLRSYITALSFPKGASVVLSAALAVALLVIAFVLGAILSNMFLCIAGIVLMMAKKSLNRRVHDLAKHDLCDLLCAEHEAREIYAYLNTGGLDLYWFAGRVRMAGGTGIALLIAVPIALSQNHSAVVAYMLALSGSLIVAMELVQAYEYRRYVGTAAVVLNCSKHRSKAKAAQQVNGNFQESRPRRRQA